MWQSECARETELLDALASGRWPSAAGEELQSHVHSCRSCSDLAVTAGAILEDSRDPSIDRDLPTSSAVWWRMQLRLRRDGETAAARTVERTYTAIVAVTLVGFLVAVAMSSLARSAWSWMTSAAADAALLPAIPIPPGVLYAIAAGVLLFTPLALYLAFAKD